MQSPHCPICKAGLPPQNPIHPNFSCEFAPVVSNSFLICVGFSGAVNDLVTKYKLDKADTAAKRKCTSLEGEKLLEAVNSANVQGWVMSTTSELYTTDNSVLVDLNKVLKAVQDRLKREEEVELSLPQQPLLVAQSASWIGLLQRNTCC